MSEKEFLQALEEDTRRKCQEILDKARIEAEAMMNRAAEEVEKMRERQLEKVKASMQSKRQAILAKARLNAREILLKERREVSARVMDEALSRLQRMRGDRDYSDTLKRLFKEAMDKWLIHGIGQKAVVILSKEDIPLLKTSVRNAGCEMVPDETGKMAPGVIIMSQDGKYRILNTLLSRFEKARPEMIAIIDRILFRGEKGHGPRLFK